MKDTKKYHKIKKHEPATVLAHIVFIILAICCIMPMILVLVISFSSSKSITEVGYSLFPAEWSLDAYKYIFKDSAMLVRSYGITIFNTVIGSSVGLILSSMMAYALSRRGYKLRTLFSFLVFFTMIFSAGLIPQYITYTKFYHMRDSLAAVILPGLVTGWNVILLRTFFYDLPEEVLESGAMDGCSEFGLYWRIAMPMMKPGLATVGLTMVLGYWNEWYRTMIYIDSSSKFDLQYMLYRLLKNAEALQQDAAAGLGYVDANFVSDTTKMAMVILAAGPMMFVFPFFQKYFVRGISTGAVKG